MRDKRQKIGDINREKLKKVEASNNSMNAEKTIDSGSSFDDKYKFFQKLIDKKQANQQEGQETTARSLIGNHHPTTTTTTTTSHEERLVSNRLKQQPLSSLSI